MSEDDKTAIIPQVPLNIYQYVENIFDDKEKALVFLPVLVSSVVCLVACGKRRRIKQEEVHWRSWMKILLIFGFVFGCFCLEKAAESELLRQKGWSAMGNFGLEKQVGSSGGALAAVAAMPHDVGPLGLLIHHPRSSLILVALAAVPLLFARFWWRRGKGTPTGGGGDSAPAPPATTETKTPPPPRVRPNLMACLPKLPWQKRRQRQQQSMQVPQEQQHPELSLRPQVTRGELPPLQVPQEQQNECPRHQISNGRIPPMQAPQDQRSQYPRPQVSSGRLPPLQVEPQEQQAQCLRPQISSGGIPPLQVPQEQHAECLRPQVFSGGIPYQSSSFAQVAPLDKATLVDPYAVHRDLQRRRERRDKLGIYRKRKRSLMPAFSSEPSNPYRAECQPYMDAEAEGSPYHGGAFDKLKRLHNVTLDPHVERRGLPKQRLQRVPKVKRPKVQDTVSSEVYTGPLTPSFEGSEQGILGEDAYRSNILHRNPKPNLYTTQGKVRRERDPLVAKRKRRIPPQRPVPFSEPVSRGRYGGSVGELEGGQANGYDERAFESLRRLHNKIPSRPQMSPEPTQDTVTTEDVPPPTDLAAAAAAEGGSPRTPPKAWQNYYIQDDDDEEEVDTEEVGDYDETLGSDDEGETPQGTQDEYDYGYEDYGDYEMY